MPGQGESETAPAGTAAGRLTEFLGLRRNLVLLLVATVTIGTGEELWSRFLPKYLEALGAAAMVIGLFDALKTLLGAVYAYPGGVVVDRWGHRRALLSFTALSIAGYVLVLAFPRWEAVLGGMCLFLAWSNLSLPAMFTLVASSLPAAKHTMGIGIQSLIKRIPIIAGPIVGGILIDRYGVARGVRIGFAISIVFGLCALVVQSRVRDRWDAVPRGPGNLMQTWRAFEPRLKRLLASDILIRFCERIPYAWVIIYAMDNAGVSGKQAGMLTAVEMLFAMACYVPAAHYAERYGKEHFVVATFVFFSLFPVTLVVAHNFTLLLVAFAVRGLKEFGEPARKALIISYAPAEMRGRAVGTYYLIRDTVVSTGSFLGAALWKFGPNANFWTAAALGAAGTILYMATSGSAREHPEMR